VIGNVTSPVKENEAIKELILQIVRLAFFLALDKNVNNYEEIQKGIEELKETQNDLS